MIAKGPPPLARLLVFSALLSLATFFSPFPARSESAPRDGGKSGLVARFMSLRSDRINLRVGPGTTYPILWVLTRKGMPVEVLREFDNWWMIRDPEGDKGWVEDSMVTPARTVLVTGAIRPLRATPDPRSPIRARAEPGVVARLLACSGAWCEIRASGISGWVKRGEIWGVFPGETVK